MALLDRLKEATRPANSIEEVTPAEARRPVADLHGANPAPFPEAQQPTPKKASSGAVAPAYATEPEAIARTYYVEERAGERRYYDDYQRKALAIRSDASSINSRREDLNTVRAMLMLAEARGWSEVRMTGTTEFRREMWIEAQARGIAAQGYKPSDLDRQEADRRRAERGQDAGRTPPAPAMNEVRQAAATGTPASTADRQQASPTTPAPAVGELRQAPAVGTAAPAPTSDQQRATPVVSLDEHRRTVRQATAELSADGKLMLSALSVQIDRQMNKLNTEAKAEMKAYVAGELVKKERAEGPIVLSAEQRQAATAPEPVRKQQPEAAPPPPIRRMEPEAPSRRLSR